MRRQVEFLQDAKKVHLCSRTIHPNIYSSAFFIFARPDKTKTQTERENAIRVKPPRIGDVQASMVALMAAILPERRWSLFN
ncbi:hypothetical protein AVEN_184185-1 [Araneus ventricosus]|uniref:Uncharacterized protein n=1 Tax=Araneus ventricosus TaxID=182803 RepID=A0A4Y2V7H5_ARAVE|nr:hypothetical protein AVEN_272205-1 [Araneus ventricosus]GBO21240.1 hypothetical protein AVEN_184185-1 [Araneus ventricosus]